MSNPINPVLGHARLKSLLFEVIGQSEILSINLPIDPPFSAIKHSRQLLLRLKWTLDAFNLSCFDPAQVLTIQSLEGSTTLRILLRILKLCSSESVHGTPPADYQVWRYIALDTMVTAMQVLLLTKYEVSPDEEDLVLSAIQQVVRIWGEARPLSASEGALLEHILPGSIGANHEEDSRVQQIPLEEALDYVSASVMDSPSVSPESFWRLYNTVSQIIFRLGVDVGDAESSFNPVRAVSVVNAIIEKSTSASGHETSIAIVKHQIQRLSLAIAPVHHPSVEVSIYFRTEHRCRYCTFVDALVSLSC
jgi:hypothetical protein